MESVKAKVGHCQLMMAYIRNLGRLESQSCSSWPDALLVSDSQPQLLITRAVRGHSRRQLRTATAWQMQLTASLKGLLLDN